jgi:hypothetical protein
MMTREEASEKYVDSIAYCDEELELAKEQSRRDFIAGAKWDKEQMMSNAVEGSITSANGALGYDIAAFRFDDNHKYTILLPHKEGRKYGDKVRIIIVNDKK